MHFNLNPRFAILLSLRAVAILAALTVGLIAFSSANGLDTAPAEMPFDGYIHRDTGASADPVNLIFVASSDESVESAVHRVLGWSVVDGSAMSFSDGGATRPSAWQMGMQFSRDSRWHLRIEQAPSTGAGSYVLAAVHRDDDAACGHVGGDFDRARDLVAASFVNDGYRVLRVALQNTNPGPQCNGTYTSGDGGAAVIDLSSKTPNVADKVVELIESGGRLAAVQGP